MEYSIYNFFVSRKRIGHHFDIILKVESDIYHLTLANKANK